MRMRYSYFFLLLLVLPVVHAESFLIKTSTDDLELNESIGDVVNAVDSTKLGLLKGGSITTKKASTDYRQYIRFKDVNRTIQAGRVTYAEDDNGDFGDFLYIDESDVDTGAVFEYELLFSSGLKGTVKSGELSDLINLQIDILGDSYVILRSTVDTSAKSISFKLASYQVRETLDQGDKKDYKIGSTKYRVEVLEVEDTATLKVNNKSFSNMKSGDAITVDNGMVIVVSNIIKSGVEQNDSVTLMVNSTLLEFADTNYEDSNFVQGFSLNKKQISEGWVKIEASLSGTNELKISNLKYRMIPQGKSAGDIYIKSGGRLSEYITNREAMLSNLWDIQYKGLASQEKSKIKLDPISRDQYSMVFTNKNGKLYKVPFLSNKGGTFSLGNENGNLSFIETASTTTHLIETGDYFILTSANDKTGVTSALKYDSIDPVSLQISFEDLNSGKFSLPILSSSVSGVFGEVTITSYGKSYKAYIKNDTTDSDAYALSIDMNGDGDVNSDEVRVVTNGGGIIDLGTTNTPSGNFDITLTTQSSQFDESSSDEVITISMEKRTNAVGISAISGIKTENQGSHTLGASLYGVYFDMFDDGSIETLSIDYPVSQVLVNVEIVTGAKEVITPTCSDGIQNQGEEDVDCGGPCAVCAKPENKTEEAPANITNATNETVSLCDGCEKDGNCYAHGTRINDLYCSSDKVLRFQKLKGKPCALNYECMSGVCVEGICEQLEEEVDYTLVILNIAALIGIIVFLILTMHSGKKKEEQAL
ncbi:MAG: hypothetical protein AABW87_00330 [Nanoarchaeota archaeon]